MTYSRFPSSLRRSRHLIIQSIVHDARISNHTVPQHEGHLKIWCSDREITHESWIICGPPSNSWPCTVGTLGASFTSSGSPPSTCMQYKLAPLLSTVQTLCISYPEMKFRLSQCGLKQNGYIGCAASSATETVGPGERTLTGPPFLMLPPRNRRAASLGWAGSLHHQFSHSILKELTISAFLPTA